MMDYGAMTIRGVSELLARGECTSEEVVRGVADTATRADTAIGAYVGMDVEYAIEQARQADKERRAGRSGPLLGIPIAVKDVLNISGQPCTCGSRILKGYVSPYDATAIARLRREGVVFLGRTNMDEFAMGSSTENSAWKVTRNPVDTSRVPGGSSGGSAAAVAGNEAIAALGTDTGGSIRQPAAFCGCFGLKPSYGRVSRYGLTAFASSLDQIGPMAKTAEDCAILLRAMAGLDPMDSTTVDAPVPDYASAFRPGLKGMVLGMPKEYFAGGIDSAVLSKIREAIDLCIKLGAEVEEVSLPHTEYAVATYYIIATAEASANLARFDGVRYGARSASGRDPLEMYCTTRSEGFGTEVKRRIILGTYVLSSGYYDAYYLTAQKVRTLIRRDFEYAFRRCHALLSPVAPTVAFKLGQNIDDPLKMYLGDILTISANLAGICGMSVPCGRTGEGLPVGLQVLGPSLKEENVLQVAYACDRAAGK